MQRVEIGAVQRTYYDELLFLLADDLKNPLVQILHLAELDKSDERIRIQAKKALQTIESVMLYKRLASGQSSLIFEPVHVGNAAVLVAQQLKPHMDMIGCRMQLEVQSALKTADVDRRVLEGGILSMSQAFISVMQSSQEIVCSIKSNTKGIRFSLLAPDVDLESFSITHANVRGTQPVTAVAGSSVDILLAHGMFGLVGAEITRSKHGGYKGIGVTLPVSRQLQFI